MNFSILIFLLLSLFDCIKTNDLIYFNSSCYDESVLKVNRALHRTSRSYKEKTEDDYSNWLNILKNPIQYDAYQRENALSHARCNYMKIFENQEYLSLDRETFKELLLSDTLEVDSEESVFESVVEWVRFNCNSMENDIHFLLSCVRFPLLSLKYIWKNVEPYTNTFEKSRSIFLEALHWHIFPEERSTNILKNWKPRKSCRNKFMCLGSYSTRTAGIVEVYEETKNKWTTYAIDIQKNSYGTAIIDNKLLIIGGSSGSKAQKSVESFDLTTRQKTSLNNLNEERFYPSVVVVGNGQNGAVYVFGGWGSKDSLKSVERWDPITQKWTMLSPMKYTRSGCAVALFNDKIYVVGGRTVEHGYSNSAEVYDPKTNSWTSIASTINRNAYATMVATSKYLYLMGGYDPEVKPVSNVERYDPKTNLWISLPSISSSGQVGGMVVDDKAATVGGTTTYVQAFNEDKYTWESLPAISVAREGYCMIIPKDSKFSW